MVTQLRQSTPVARKAHRCGMCNGSVQPGERYHRSTNLFDGRVYDFITCSPCESDGILAEVHAWCGSPWEGVSAEDAYEWAHDNRDQPAAAAWLTRYGCNCEGCAPDDDPTGTPMAGDTSRAGGVL